MRTRNKLGSGFTKKNVKVTIRIERPYKIVKRNVYFKSGVGTYIIYKGKNVGVSYTAYNNTAHTIDFQRHKTYN